MLILAAAAWVTRVAVTGFTMRSGAGFSALVLEAALAGTLVVGLVSTIDIRLLVTV